MEQIRVFKQKSLLDLNNYLNKESLSKLEELFTNKDWVKDWFTINFKGEDWFFDSNVEYTPVNLLPEIKYDIINAEALHESLPLTRVQAVDERLWSYLSLVTYWDYTKDRWTMKSEKASEESKRTTITSRYGMKSSAKTDRPFLRNSISRLWWAAEMTKDENREDPYELTELILSNTDIYQQVMERSFSRNEQVIRGIAELFHDLGEEVYLKNRFYRIILKEINALGGIVMLDFLDKEDLKKYVKKNLSL